MSENTTAKKTGVDKLIDGIEKVCNKLPPRFCSAGFSLSQPSSAASSV